MDKIQFYIRNRDQEELEGIRSPTDPIIPSPVLDGGSALFADFQPLQQEKVFGFVWRPEKRVEIQITEETREKHYRGSLGIEGFNRNSRELATYEQCRPRK